METIVIIGASRGIGASLAMEYSKNKNKLFILGRDLEKLEEVSKKCENNGSIVEIFQCDLCDDLQLNKLIEHLKNMKIDKFIYNAGNAYVKDFKELSEIEIEKQIKVNNYIPTILSHKLIDSFIKNKTSIAYICSVASYLYGPRVAIYFATKAYLKSFAYSLYEELKPYGIKVSAIHPGFVETDMLKNNIGNIKLPKFMVQSSEEIAKQAYNCINKGNRSGIIGRRNILILFFSKLLFGNLFGKFFYKINKNSA